jgi:hypothetical protein
LKTVQYYVELAADTQELARASRFLASRKKSALGRRVERGDITAIIKLARDRLISWARSLGGDFCKRLCELLKSSQQDKIRLADVLVLAAATAIGFANVPASVAISLVWIYRAELLTTVCDCTKKGI